MKKSTIIFALFFFALGAHAVFAQDKSADKEKFLKAVQALEDDPLAATAKETRKWALPYSQDVDYPFCEMVAFLFVPKEVRGEILAQYLMKVAAIHLENAGKKYDVNEAQLAGVESALKVYEKLVKADATAKSKKMDYLIGLRDKNELLNMIKLANCKDQK